MLSLTLRRLTAMEASKLEKEKDELQRGIAGLQVWQRSF